MKYPVSTDSQSSSNTPAPQVTGLFAWSRFSKRISWYTIPLLGMATVTEFAILAVGWKYQQVACLPQGMAVTFLGIGPIGATILAVELLKLPLAIWTASRTGWAKVFMLFAGLPLICLLTFQLVKDMAVYEMGVAMTPASQALEKAMEEEVKISQLNGQLSAIEGKKTDREKKLTDLSAKEAKAKADLEDSLKRNEEARKDAIALTDYQKKELSEVEMRESGIIVQFNQDTAQINKALADLRAQREVEVGRGTKWNAEEARIDNAYKAKLADYQNKKAAYEKAKAEYDSANFIKRQVLSEPVDPGVPPVRESNTVLKPTTVAEIDDQIKTKEAELLAVNNKRRDRVAQVEADAHKLREEYDNRSVTKREEADKKRAELTDAETALATEWKTERSQIDQELAAAVKNVDGIHAEIDAARKRAESDYEVREASIRKTQVHRIATTVEIVRGLIKGERPVSIKATAKERGDLLTDQISMVRIWVYPVLAFIVAFLPTLMVEIGFSTVFVPEQQRKQYRIGFLGQRLHWLYTRAGRIKILRAERLASEASGAIAARDRALQQKEAELQSAREAVSAAAAQHEEHLKQTELEHTEAGKRQESEWVAKLAGMADSLNRTVVEKDALRDLQKSEIERQIQLRQNAWSDRLTQLRQELDEQRTSAEAERMATMQDHHKKLMEVTEDCKNQVVQARRQASDAELAAMEASARLTNDLKEAQRSRDLAETQLQHQSDAFALKLAQARDEAAREVEKAARQDKHRLERQQIESSKTLRQREEEFEHKLQTREQELSLAFDARLAEEQSKLEAESRRREAELARQIDARALEVEARWKQEMLQREEAAQVRLRQREQQLQSLADSRLHEVQSQAEQETRRLKSELEHQLGTQSRETDTRWKQEWQQKEMAFEARLKQREQEAAIKAESRETELQKQWASDLHIREEEWERQAQARVRAAEGRLDQQARQAEELFQSKLRQRDQQWQAKVDAAKAELQAQHEDALRRREAQADAEICDLEARLRREMQQRDEIAEAKVKQREQELDTQFTTRVEARQLAAQAQWEAESEKRIRAVTEPLRALLSRTEKERDEARQLSSEGARQVQTLEKKLTEASAFLSAWRNGKNIVGATG